MTRQQKLPFYHDGYLKISSVLPLVLVDRALRAINYSLGAQGTNKNDLLTLRKRSCCIKDKKQMLKYSFNRSPIFPQDRVTAQCRQYKVFLRSQR